MGLKIVRKLHAVEVLVRATISASAFRLTVGPDAAPTFLPGTFAVTTIEIYTVLRDGVDIGVVYQRNGRRWYAAQRTADGLVELPINLGTRDFAVAALCNTK